MVFSKEYSPISSLTSTEKLSPPLKNWFTARVFSYLTEVSKKMGVKKYIFAPITGDRGLNERRGGALQLNLGGGWTDMILDNYKDFKSGWTYE